MTQPKDNNMQNQQAAQDTSNPQVIIQQEPKSNNIGTAGFILAIIALFLGWVPFLGWLIWLLGLIFSFVGVLNQPRGLSIAGLVISFLGVILLFLFFGAVIGTSLLSSF